MRLLLLVLLSPLVLFSQTQIHDEIVSETVGDYFGHAVSTSSDGSILAIGAPGSDFFNVTGKVSVFRNNGNAWIQIGQDINGEQQQDQFGSCVSISSDGDILAIGVPDYQSSEIAGRVRVFEYIDNVWTQIGNDINGDSEGVDGDGFPINVRFGANVSISNDGNIVAIAKPRGSTSENGYGNPGYMHIYENISGTWTQIGDAINTEITFLYDISISGDGYVVAISGRGDTCTSGCSSIGYVNVYRNTSGVWTQIGNTVNGEDDGYMNSSNTSISLNNNGSILAVGGVLVNKIFENISDEWVQLGDDIDTLSVTPKISLSGDGTVLAFNYYVAYLSGPDAVALYKYISGAWTYIGGPFWSTDGAFGFDLELSNDGFTLAVGNPYENFTRVYDLTALLSVDESNILGVKLYPNPTSNQFTIALPESQTLEKVNIYNSLGQFIQTTTTRFIKTSHLVSGIYYVEVITNSGKSTKKLIIE